MAKKRSPLKDMMNRSSSNVRDMSDLLDDVKDSADDEPTQRLNADVPESLHRAVRMKAAEEGTSIKQIVIEALSEHLSK